MVYSRYVLDIELAGVPIQLRTRERTWDGVFRDYLTDKAPLFAIEPQDEDLERAHAEIIRTDAIMGRKTEISFGRFTLEHTAVHMLIAERLLPYNVLIVHGSAIRMDGKAYLFSAKSGTGKSTHTRLWREAFGARVQMINDDKPMVRIENDGVTVYGNPWEGKHRLGGNIEAPMQAVAFVRQNDTNRVKSLSKADAFQELVTEVQKPSEPELVPLMTSLVTKMAEGVDFFELFCNMSIEAAYVSYNSLAKQANLRG